MNRHKWVLIAAMAFGVPAVTPACLFAAPSDAQIRSLDWDELPRQVQRTIREQSHGEHILRLSRITYEGRVSYRATFADHGTERKLRVARDGDVINDTELDRWGRYRPEASRDVRETHQTIHFRDIPQPARDRISREVPRRNIDNVEEVDHGGYIYYIVDGDNGHRIRVDREGRLLSDNEPRLMSNVRSDRYWDKGDLDRQWDQYTSGKYLDFRDLPGEVKQAIGSRTGQGDRVTDVVHLNNGDYLATVESGDGKFSKMYHVTANGKILSAQNATEEGAVPVRFDNLPGPVKDAFSHEGNPRDYRRVMQITRDGHTFYMGVLRSGDHPRIVRVSPHGQILE